MGFLKKRKKRKFWNSGPLVIPQGGKPLDYSKKLLQAKNDFWCAGAVWERIDGQWRCTEAAPIIRWMLKMTPENAKLELAKRGCQWQWITP